MGGYRICGIIAISLVVQLPERGALAMEG